MREVFRRVERVGFAHVAEIIRRVFGADAKRWNAEQSSFCERALVSRRTRGRRKRLLRAIELRGASRSAIERRGSIGADRTLAFDPDRESIALGFGADFHDLAVIDGREETAFGLAPLKPGAAPA